MASYWNPDYVEHASRRYTIFRFVVYFILNRDKAKASENQNITFKNTLASLVLKRLHNIQKYFSISIVLKRVQVHFILTSGHRLKVVDNGINESETTACSLISSLYYAVAIGL